MIRDRVFISYQRSDAPDAVGDLRQALVTHFGDAAVFQDTTKIRAGEAFPERLRNELGRAACVLVVIGNRWDPKRLHDPGDGCTRSFRSLSRTEM